MVNILNSCESCWSIASSYSRDESEGGEPFAGWVEVCVALLLGVWISTRWHPGGCLQRGARCFATS